MKKLVLVATARDCTGVCPSVTREEEMKQKTIIRNTLVVLAAAFALTGCGSVRMASTLKPSGEKDLRLGSARFSLISHGIEYNKNDPGAKNWLKGLDQTFIAGRAKALYPELFTDDWTGLPVIVKTKGEYDDSSMMISAFLTALTAGVIPFPGTCTLNIIPTVTASPPNPRRLIRQNLFT